MYSEFVSQCLLAGGWSLNSLTDCVCIVSPVSINDWINKMSLNSLTDCVCIVRNNFTSDKKQEFGS